MLQSAPAWGKSTLAQKMHKEDPNKVIVSRDDIRASRGKYWIPEQEDYISDVEEFEIRAAIKRGLSPIIDATNLNPKTIDKWNKLASELNVELETIALPYVPFKEALERDKNRERSVGEKTLKSFYLRYYPTEYKKELEQEIKISSEPDNSLPPAVIFDLDLTICFATDRGPYEYAKAASDKVDPKAKWMIERWIADGILPIFLTGRDNTPESIDAIHTALGIDKVKKMDGECYPYIIFGRNKGDYRHSVIVKEEIYDNQVAGKYNVIMAFDDDAEVVEMYKRKGIFASKV